MMFKLSLFAAPHRVMFLGGTIQALLSMAFWSLQTGGHYAGLWPAPGWPLLTLLPASQLHALLMGSGVFPWFIFGFILTAGPRWQGASDLRAIDYLPPFFFLAAGWTLVWVSMFFPSFLVAGLALVFTGWLLIAWKLIRLALLPAAGREHIAYVATAACLGSAGLVAFIALPSTAFLGRIGIALTIWGFLLPVFVTVAHRMLPFFSAAVVRGYVVHRPIWALRTLIAASLGHGALGLIDLPQWLWLVDLPAAIAAGRLSWLWWRREVQENRLVLVLHVAFAWLVPSFVMFAMQSALFQVSPGFLGQAPMHALTIGFFSSMLIAMASRVTLGHSGRPVVGDATMWTAFCLIQAAAVIRVSAEFLIQGGAAIVMWISSVVWLMGLAIWASRYAPALWRPRDDGKPG